MILRATIGRKVCAKSVQRRVCVQIVCKPHVWLRFVQALCKDFGLPLRVAGLWRDQNIAGKGSAAAGSEIAPEIVLRLPAALVPQQRRLD
jgi:hypothetical protein